MITRIGRFQMLWTAGAIGVAGAVALTGCENSPAAIDEKAITMKAALNAEAMMHESGQALGFTVSDDGTVRKLMGSTSATATSVVSPVVAGSMPPSAMLRAMVGPQMAQQMTGYQFLPSMMTTEERFDDVGKQLRRQLTERLFVDANFESKSAGTATYLLHADPTCRPLTQDTDPVGFVPAVDQTCADDLTKVDVRVAVQADGDGTRMTVLIGQDHLELIAVIIHTDELAFELDLPKTKAASDLIQQKIGDGNPTGSYDRLVGKMRGSLKRAGAKKVTAAYAILQDLDIAQTSTSTEIKVAATNPVVALTSDGVSSTAELQFGLGATDIAGTWDPHSTGVANRDLHMVIGGMYGTLSLDENAKEILMTDVGIGESKLSVRGSSIVDLNLNADAMRRFSGKVTVNAQGNARVEVTPKFDLSLAFDYNSVASELSSPPDATVASETYGVTLSNGGSATILEAVPGTATFSGGIKMVAGTLVIKAKSVPAQTVTVAAGQCLVSVTAPANTQPILGSLSATTCP